MTRKWINIDRILILGEFLLHVISTKTPVIFPFPFGSAQIALKLLTEVKIAGLLYSVFLFFSNTSFLHQQLNGIKRECVWVWLTCDWEWETAVSIPLRVSWSARPTAGVSQVESSTQQLHTGSARSQDRVFYVFVLGGTTGRKPSVWPSWAA